MNPPYDWAGFVRFRWGYKSGNVNSYPSPDSDPLAVYIMLPSPDPVKATSSQQSPRITPSYGNPLCCVYLIPGLKKPKVVSHRVPQLPPLVTRPTPVNDHHDVLVVRGQDRVPVSVKADVHLLRARPIVPVGGCTRVVVMVMLPSALLTRSHGKEQNMNECEMVKTTSIPTRS